VPPRSRPLPARVASAGVRGAVRAGNACGRPRRGQAPARLPQRLTASLAGRNSVGSKRRWSLVFFSRHPRRALPEPRDIDLVEQQGRLLASFDTAVNRSGRDVAHEPAVTDELQQARFAGLLVGGEHGRLRRRVSRFECQVCRTKRHAFAYGHSLREVVGNLHWAGTLVKLRRSSVDDAKGQRARIGAGARRGRLDPGRLRDRL
jgi:hypothetical protein